ncbi:hypothetical protein AB4218_25130 [Vibrio splendidus]
MKLDMKILGIGFIAVIVLSLLIEHCFSIFFNPNALLVSTDSYEHLLMGRLQLILIISPRSCVNSSLFKTTHIDEWIATYEFFFCFFSNRFQ